MKDLCIQIQPRRATGLVVADVIHRCETLRNQGEEISRFAVTEGDDEGPYVNLMFATDSISSLWELLKRELYADTVFGSHLLTCSMAMSEGNNGWDDYLQLFHFDPLVRVAKGIEE
jgi:hypothetical protein